MYIVTAKEMYKIDRETIGTIGLDAKILMENAGREASREIEKRISKEDKVVILIGGGNNGGDGFVIARVLSEAGYPVKAIQVAPDEKITGDAAYHKEIYRQFGGRVEHYHEAWADIVLKEADVIIDAMLGIGVRGELRGDICTAARQVNEQDAYVISIDIPSGLPAEEGLPVFQAIKADATIMIGAVKQSAVCQHTSSYYGEWIIADIGFPGSLFQAHTKRRLWTTSSFQESFPKREVNSHKGDHGRGLIIGGSQFMPGSVLMTTKAALRTGAGLLTTASVKGVISMIAGNIPEAMYIPTSEKNGYVTGIDNIDLSSFDAIAVGIGLGRREETGKEILPALLGFKGPILVDADGLYHLKSYLTDFGARQAPLILTPHPGELAALMDMSVSDLLLEPFRCSSEFAKRYNCYLVLKGKHTIITDPEGNQTVESSGNPGLAKGGSGDVLTGMILAMIMQSKSIFAGINNACFLHGKSADLLVQEKHSEQDLLAGDVIQGIPKAIRTFS
ncbi:NAD(P)H-hydrate dehydratase [Oceanobacillus neutriphilus]|uniref:Bifunctional NAD(P)H-hydrate repair enzyme n=1 Tax=Oceanobacillus neutriphilus TaxID=531815 RepID=A0ABQ2P011_9BACI|nr:NAD(P)H-hydrate dehydratase [Oceanobacillus neutriphilus]GGP14787.1 bifunctional NAD(P)H-hydrate repair enzyme Nnr [Oceanobacillus neutriphilus]